MRWLAFAGLPHLVATRLVSVVVLAATITFVSSARAGIEDDVVSLERALRPTSGAVSRLEPRFLEEGELARLVLPPAPSMGVGCRVVVLVASPAIRFAAAPTAGASGVAVVGDEPSPSSAGILSVPLCGDARDGTVAILLRMISPRGAVGGLVVDGPARDVDVPSILPDRAREPRLALRAPGPPLSILGLAERVESFDERARRRGYAPALELDLAHTGERDAFVALELSSGCHLVGGIVEPSGNRVDADLVLDAGGTPLAVDRTESADGEVRLCLAEPTAITARVRASHAFDDGRLTVASRELPAAIDPTWGALATTGYATLFVRRAGPVPTRRATTEILGVQGSTQITFAPVAGRCYLAGLALVRGPSRGMRIRARAEGQSLSDETPRPDEGLGIVLCSESGAPFRIAVDVPSPQAWWLLSIWPLAEER